VSTGAVSLILRHSGRFSVGTRKRVLEVAKRMKYRPNPIAASYKSGRFKELRATQAVPLAIVYNLSRPGLGAPGRRAEELGYRLGAFDLREYPSPRRLGDVLFARGYRGILLSQLYGVNELPDLGWERFCCVCVSRPFFEVPFDVVGIRLFETVIDAWRRCREAGYERIGFDVQIHRSWGDLHPDDRARYAAALFCLEQTARKNRIPPHVARASERESFVKWVEKYQPEAVVGSNAGRYEELCKMGRSAEKGYGFLALNINPEDRITSGYGGDQGLAVLTAVDMIDRHVRHNLFGPRENPLEHLLPQPWREGQTLSGRMKVEG